MRQFVPCLAFVTFATLPVFAQTPSPAAPVAAPMPAVSATRPIRAASLSQAPTQPPSAPQAARTATPVASSNAPAAPGVAPSRALPSLAVNVKLDLAITDTYGGTPSKKTVTLLVANGGNGMVRTANRLPDNSPVDLNVDANVHVYQNNVVMLSLTFQYTPAQAATPGERDQRQFASRPADLNESVNVILEDGKPTIVSQSADPATDRKVTAEVTATIVK